MKTRNLIVLSIIALILGISSCRDDFDFDLASDNLSFSSDTLNLDTIFNYTNSQTYKLTIHNNQDEDVQIPRIFLSRGESSLFKINVDGMAGFEFENVAVRKNDSIFIFVEIAAGEVLNNSIYEDEINFETTAGNQQVKLLSYLEKAKFYNTEQSDNYPLTETNWDNQWSRVLFGNINAGDLTISAGTKVYFHNDAELNVTGTFNVNGAPNQKVIFRTDRMDDRSDSIPNAWGKIKLKSPNNSVLNTINYAVIRGANTGLEVQDSRLDISNTKIQNNENFGLLAYNSIINGRNLVLTNANLATLGLEGGSYDFRQCTFANYLSTGQSSGNSYSLILSNDSFALNQANFYNNIFYGISANAIAFDSHTSNNFIYDFDYNVMRLDVPGELPSTEFTNNLVLQTSDLLFVETEDLFNDLRLILDTPAAGHANLVYLDSMTNSDILGESRGTSPNPGAYQTPINPED